TMDGYKFRYTMGSLTGSPCVLHLPPAQVIYVNASAAPGGDGATWLTAYNDLQTALASQQGCRRFIWVAAGTYSPGTNSDATYSVPSGTAIYGGFVGNEISVAQRNAQANPTILTGAVAMSTDVVTFDGTFTAIGTNTVLDGVIVQSGNQAG